MPPGGAGLPIKSQLQYYASQFQTAELNRVFYRMPSPEAVTSWKEQFDNDQKSAAPIDALKLKQMLLK